MEKNQFRLADVILSVICVVFVAEAAAPVASIGNSQYFWWIFMILAFLLPYGLIAAELGTAYAGDGGLYDWIHAAYPNGKWAARASWYYWINFPLWMASLAVMCPELITFITGRSLGTFGSLVVELLFIWIVTLIACYPVCDSIIILNVSAVIKIVLALLVGGLGVWYISRYGFVNDMSARTFLPSFDLNSLSYISVIIFNFLGFEVVCTYANNMSDPKKQIPQSIVTGGIVIAAIYLFSAFGIGAAVVAVFAVLYLNFMGYASARVTAWRDPASDPAGDGYQILQSLYAIGSGGLMGLGLGRSRQKYLYLPEEHNDYIFPILCEELGFVGAVVVILLFILLIVRGYYIAMHARDRFGALLAAGISTHIALQTFLNICVVTNFLPATGISLPFFSYGGTALLMQLFEAGVVLAVSRQNDNKLL